MCLKETCNTLRFAIIGSLVMFAYNTYNGFMFALHILICMDIEYYLVSNCPSQSIVNFCHRSSKIYSLTMFTKDISFCNSNSLGDECLMAFCLLFAKSSPKSRIPGPNNDAQACFSSMLGSPDTCVLF